MAYSSILGATRAPATPSGRDSDLLGPSDNSDSGSDTAGTAQGLADTDSAGTGERGAVAGPDAPDGADILPDHVVQLGVGPGSAHEAQATGELTDLSGQDGDTPLADEEEDDAFD